MNDQQVNLWLDRLITGDPAAFDAIYAMTRNKIYGTVASLVTNREDVNDIVSEVYCQLWKALPGYDRTRPFLFWLNGIVIKQVYNWRRQIWRRFRLLEKKNRLDVGEPEVVKPDDIVMDNESNSEMISRINKLPFKLRIVLIYRYYYDFTNDEIAELLQIPAGTVRSRHHLALKQLRKRFANHLDREVCSKHV